MPEPSTDFNVGNTIKFLQDLNYSVRVKRRHSPEREEERKNDEEHEREKWEKMGYILLNKRLGYNPRTAGAEVRQAQLRSIKSLGDELSANLEKRKSTSQS